MNLKPLYDDLIRHEGLRQFPYKDTVGKTTIGVGRNLTDVGISKHEALMLLQADVNKLLGNPELLRIMEPHNEVRQQVLLNMAFNMGVSGLMGFRNMLRALQIMDYDEVAKQMLDSRWAKQVGHRATELAVMMKTGKRGD